MNSVSKLRKLASSDKFIMLKSHRFFKMTRKLIMQHCESVLPFAQHHANSTAAMLATLLVSAVVIVLVVVCQLFQVLKKTNFLCV